MTFRGQPESKSRSDKSQGETERGREGTDVGFAEQLDAFTMLVVSLFNDAVSVDGVGDDVPIFSSLGTQWLCQFAGGRSRPLLLELRAKLVVRLLFLIQALLSLETQKKLPSAEAGLVQA